MVESCPNLAPDAPVDATGCGGTGLISWNVDGTDHPIPCGWCWRAAGYDGPLIPQIPDLVRLTVALDEVLEEPAQPPLFGDVTRGRKFDRLCERVHRFGISDSVRDAWIAWVRERTPAVDTVASGTGGGRR